MPYAFELSGQPEQSARLIRAIPDDWCCASGRLEAPPVLEATGRIARAGYAMGSWNKISVVTLADHYQNPGYRVPEEIAEQATAYRRTGIDELIVEGRLPLFIAFDRAGASHAGPNVVPLELVKRLILRYLHLGYTGALSFFSASARPDETEELPEEVKIYLGPFEERWLRDEDRGRDPLSRFTTFDETVKAVVSGQITLDELDRKPLHRTHPPLVMLRWNPEYGGSEEHLSRLIELCRLMDLAELDPSSIKYGLGYTFQIDF